MFYLTLENQIYIGQANQQGSTSNQQPNFSVIFEDDGETGYFYAIDMQQDPVIVDSVHIYNVSAVEERHIARKLQICWNKSGDFAILLINDYPHAAFDFVKLIGYNHSKFPPSNLTSLWSREEIGDEQLKQWLK